MVIKKSSQQKVAKWAKIILLTFSYLFLLFFPLPLSLQFYVVMQKGINLIHIPLFAFLTFQATTKLSISYRAGILIVIGLGLISELLQPIFGRYFEWIDLVNNCAGIAIYHCAQRLRNKTSFSCFMGTLFFLLIAIVQIYYVGTLAKVQKELNVLFPVLCNFDDPRVSAFWKPTYSADLAVSDFKNGSCPANERVLTLSTDPSLKWPGGVFQGFPSDWRGYEFLSFDVRIMSEIKTDIPMGVRLEDQGFLEDGAWYYYEFTANKDWKRIFLPLRKPQQGGEKRPIFLDSIITIKIYFSRPLIHSVAQVDDIVLTKGTW